MGKGGVLALVGSKLPSAAPVCEWSLAIVTALSYRPVEGR